MSTLPRYWRIAALKACIACAVSGCAITPAPRDTVEPGAVRDVLSSPEPAPKSPKSTAPASVSKPSSAAKPGLDHSGGKQVGKASFYADKFAGRKMADGTRMDPHDDNAASKTLPLGTTAKVTNLETGDSAVVTIQDRGPYVKDRIIDLSPSTARKIGISRQDGLAEVEVTPLAIPENDGAKAGGPRSDDKGYKASGRHLDSHEDLVNKPVRDLGH